MVITFSAETGELLDAQTAKGLAAASTVVVGTVSHSDDEARGWYSLEGRMTWRTLDRLQR